MELGFKEFKKQAIKAAKDLLYGNEVVKQLEAAKTIAEMDRIMKTALEQTAEECSELGKVCLKLSRKFESIYATKEKRWYERLKEAGEETE